MIVFLREKFIAKIFMTVVGIVFIIGTVLLFDITGGRQASSERDEEVVAKIGGAEVNRGHFETLVNQEVQRRRDQSQGSRSIDRKQVERDIVDRLVQEQIWLGSTEVTDAEIDRYVRSDPALLSNYNLFHARGFRDAYRQSVRLQMSLENLRNDIQGLELVTDTDLENEYRRQNNKAKLKYIQFKNNDYRNAVKIDDAEVQSYFEDNKENYKNENQANVKYVKIDPKEFVSDEEVRNYYDTHLDEFKTPEIVKARHILKKYPTDATDEQKAEAKTAAEELLEKVTTEISDGADFGELAEKYSEDTGSAVKGGALRGRHPKLPPTGDFFARGDMVPEFEKACFDDLAPGEISDLIETQFGYHIIKLEERRPEEIKPFSQAEFDVRKKLVQIDGVAKAKGVADELIFDVEIFDYQEAVKQDRYKDLALTVQETGFFTQDENRIPTIGGKGSFSGLIEEVFDVEVGVSRVIETKNWGGEIAAYFVAIVLDKKPGSIPDFESVRTEVVEDFRQERAKQMALEDAKKLIDQHSDGESLEKLVEKYVPADDVTSENREVKESDSFSLSPRVSYIPGMGRCRDAMLAAFNLELNAVGGPYEGNTAFYIVQLVDREEADIEKFQNDPEERVKLRRTVLQSKKNDVYSNWFAARKNQTPTEVHADFR